MYIKLQLKIYALKTIWKGPLSTHNIIIIKIEKSN